MLPVSGKSSKGPEWMGHPPGLFVLAGVELWERFSFYGLRALLIPYLLSRPSLHEFSGLERLSGLLGATSKGETASAIYGLYSGFVYFTPLLGGYLADRWKNKTILIASGSLLLLLGHLLLISPHLFLMGLICIILGTGGIKGNIAAQLGELYAPSDQRRETGFSIFYVGINIGATLAPVVCGVLAQYVGWQAAFASTSIGMAIGLLLYGAGLKWLRSGAAHSVGTCPTADRTASAARIGQSAIVLGAVVFCCTSLLWVSYEQQANALMRWCMPSGQNVSLVWLQSVPSVVVLLGTPLVLGFYRWRSSRGHAADPLSRMTAGAGILVLAQVMLVLGALAVNMLGHPGAAPSIWLVTAYLVVWEIGDLCFTPAAMGLFSRLAPADRNALPLALWYLTFFFGNLGSGWIGMRWGHVSVLSYWLSILIPTLLGAGGILMCRLRHRLSLSASSQVEMT
ncbi:peptide MFS transporter [Gluconobacter oxydans]|uniref:peptide MFS transporter n=1 Tax=Gluconobacter oxydans TaxID=442 RepID=UPI0039EAF14E